MSGWLLTDIGKLTRGMRFYRMVPGRLGEMGDMVEELVKTGNSA